MSRRYSLLALFAGAVAVASLLVFVDFFRSTFFLVLLMLVLIVLVAVVITLPEVVWKAKLLWSGLFGYEKRLETARLRSKVSPLLNEALRRSDTTSCRSAIDYCIGDAHGLGQGLLSCCDALISLRKTHRDAISEGLPREMSAALDAQIRAAGTNLSATSDRIAMFSKQGAWNERIAGRVEDERRRLDELAQSMRECQGGLAELMLVGMEGPGLDLLSTRLGALGEAAQELSDAVA